MSLAQLLSDGSWTTPPVEALMVDGVLCVDAREGSDAWRQTSYGFIHDTEHALLEPFPAEGAIEVEFLLDFDQQFDQAGAFLRVNDTEWIKAGVEVSDGVVQVGAVVTHTTSDWSVAPVPEWSGKVVTIRMSRSGDAITVRAKVAGGSWQLVRVAHLDDQAEVTAGIYCCSPTRSGLRVSFTGYQKDDADEALHPES